MTSLLQYTIFSQRGIVKSCQLLGSKHDVYKLLKFSAHNKANAENILSSKVDTEQCETEKFSVTSQQTRQACDPENASQDYSAGSGDSGGGGWSGGDGKGGLSGKASAFITSTSSLQQFGIGIGIGTTTGIIAKKIGKPAAITVGGGMILVAAINQAGLVKIDLNNVGKKVSEATKKVEYKYPQFRSSFEQFARQNPYFVIGLVGGFLVGIAI